MYLELNKIYISQKRKLLFLAFARRLVEKHRRLTFPPIRVKFDEPLENVTSATHTDSARYECYS